MRLRSSSSQHLDRRLGVKFEHKQSGEAQLGWALAEVTRKTGEVSGGETDYQRARQAIRDAGLPPDGVIELKIYLSELRFKASRAFADGETMESHNRRIQNLANRLRVEKFGVELIMVR